MKAKLQNLMASAKSNAARVGMAGMGLVASASSFASGTTSPTGPDFTQITNNITFSTVATGIMAIAVLVAGVYVTISGAKIILRFVKSA